MDPAVGLVQAYLRLNGYFTETEYPIVTLDGKNALTLTDVDILAIRARPWFMKCALHMNVSMGENVTTLTTFISGLVIWNVVAFLAAWLLALLHNNIKQ